MALIQVRAIEDQPGMSTAIGNYLHQTLNTVCGVCGFEAFGHRPDYLAKGYETHTYTPIPA